MACYPSILPLLFTHAYIVHVGGIASNFPTIGAVVGEATTRLVSTAPPSLSIVAGCKKFDLLGTGKIGRASQGARWGFGQATWYCQFRCGALHDPVNCAAQNTLSSILTCLVGHHGRGALALLERLRTPMDTNYGAPSRAKTSATLSLDGTQSAKGRAWVR